jgi:hypothetical protein
MPEGGDDLGMNFDDLVRDHFLLGPVAEVTGQILHLARWLGAHHLAVPIQWPGMPQSLVLDQMHLLSEEVFPAVRQGL